MSEIESNEVKSSETPVETVTEAPTETPTPESAETSAATPETKTEERSPRTADRRPYADNHGGGGGSYGQRRGNDRGGGRGNFRQRRRRFQRRKVCPMCERKMDSIDYKDVSMLCLFITDRGKIRPRRMTGACAKHQRQVTTAVKRARNLALIPFKV